MSEIEFQFNLYKERKTSQAKKKHHNQEQSNVNSQKFPVTRHPRRHQAQTTVRLPAVGI